MQLAHFDVLTGLVNRSFRPNTPRRCCPRHGAADRKWASFFWIWTASNTSTTGQAVDEPQRGGLSLVYQPQIDADGRRLLGLEVLLRWDDPVLGSISPAEFIGVAEGAGIIDRLGAWVLQTACRQLAAWHACADAVLFAQVRLAVNISPIEFARPGFLDHVREALRDLGSATRRLVELEITESLLVQVAADVTERLHDLGLRVVAEGVETPEQRDFLRQHGCDAFQGWLYARAMAPAELLVWLRARQSVPV